MLDEAFLAYYPAAAEPALPAAAAPSSTTGSSTAAADVTATASADHDVADHAATATNTLLDEVAASGDALRQAVLDATCFRASVGVGSNRLLAKLASRAAKPYGTRVLRPGPVADAAVAGVPVAKLPGCGGRVAAALAAAVGGATGRGGSGPGGEITAGDVRAALPTLDALRRALPQLPERTARTAWDRLRGLDPAPVQATGPPKALHSQCSLTPLVLLRFGGGGDGGNGGGNEGGRQTPADKRAAYTNDARRRQQQRQLQQ